MVFRDLLHKPRFNWDLSGREQGKITHTMATLRQRSTNPKTVCPTPSLWLVIHQTVELVLPEQKKNKQSKRKSDNNYLLQEQNLPETSRQKKGILAPRKDAAEM